MEIIKTEDKSNFCKYA